MDASFGILVGVGALILLTLFLVFGLLTDKVFYNPSSKTGLVIERKEALDALDQEIHRGSRTSVQEGLNEYHTLYKSKVNILRGTE